jgi:hypothetical protein
VARQNEKEEIKEMKKDRMKKNRLKDGKEKRRK